MFQEELRAALCEVIAAGKLGVLKCGRCRHGYRLVNFPGIVWLPSEGEFLRRHRAIHDAFNKDYQRISIQEGSYANREARRAM